jgi:pimeloyl-ACP methyl ester carboxylesterase
LASYHPLFEGTEGNVTVLPECGHLAMVEQPQALAKTIRAIVPMGQPPIPRPQPSSSVRQ